MKKNPVGRPFKGNTQITISVSPESLDLITRAAMRECRSVSGYFEYAARTMAEASPSKGGNIWIGTIKKKKKSEF